MANFENPTDSFMVTGLGDRAEMLKKSPTFTLPGRQQSNVNTLWCDALALAEILSKEASYTMPTKTITEFPSGVRGP